ncbi:hypothetical protein D0469_00370 [Peribacillus saganii]|uniref:Uncharacterized protein n=1 Tax=Peribacillus saganii TaxID=2303992 RepID=A0A372LUV4_9BACI|nr:hypothetical protein D0469_00370 [Peribacillus saganii]
MKILSAVNLAEAVSFLKHTPWQTATIRARGIFLYTVIFPLVFTQNQNNCDYSCEVRMNSICIYVRQKKSIPSKSMHSGPDIAVL